MFKFLKFKVINRVNLRVDVYLKRKEDLITVNDQLHLKYMGKNIHLIEYFDDKKAAKQFFRAVADDKVSDFELDRLEEHYIAEMNLVTTELRRHKNSELIKKYYL